MARKKRTSPETFVKPVLTQARVRELFCYNPYTGELTRRTSRGGKAAGSVAGTLRKDGYIGIAIDEAEYLIHRVMFLYVHGYMPAEVDHRDLDKTNNCIGNLRASSRQQNMENVGIRKNNTSGFRKNNTSGFKGVTWHNVNLQWQARIAVGGKRKSLGYFNTPEEAHKAYCKAAKAHFGEFARVA